MNRMWHSLSWQEALQVLNSNLRQGLSDNEVKIREKEFGKNKLPEEKPLSKLKIYLEQFKSPLIYILIFAGIITLFLREFTDAIVIFAAVIVNSTVGFIQENKASKSLKELKKAVTQEAEVLRGGNLKIINSQDVVPGDIIILNPGDKVFADARIIESQDLKVNEMALTGEWLPSEKISRTLLGQTHLMDRDNMVYMGCVVEAGRGKAVVTETGLNTEIGKVAQMIKETPEGKTPYQKKLSHFSTVVGIGITVMCIFIFLEGLIKGKEFIEMFTTSIALAVAAIPEGLPMAMTVILALGMQRVLKKKGLIRRLSSAETLGSTSIICTDKTGTLTEGKMKVAQIIGDKILTLKSGVLISEAFVENPDSPIEQWILRGRPTDRALLEAGIENGLLNIKKEMEQDKISEVPFNPINKFSAVLYKESGEMNLYVCGAPERIFKRSNLTDQERRKLEEKLKELTGKGLRVLATGYRKVDKSENITYEIKGLKAICQNFIFTGFIALSDPIRKEAKQAIKICQKAGMRLIIVTGDHKLTAKAVAEELGFKITEENVLEGMDLDKLSDKEFEEILDKIQIYARAEPKHKMRIINAWQDRGEVVAMTGDGINDAPALKKADIGIALGSGTAVAKESSDLILLNDSFSIIIKAIEEGRVIIDNIRKVITYLLSDSFTEIILVGASVFVGAPLPIIAVQILWINLIEDGLPGMALAFEPKEKEIMQQKPATHEVPLLTKEMKFIIVIIGLITDAILLGLFFWLWKQGLDITYIRTMIFACLTIDSLFYVFSCKSLRKNLWHINLFSNKFLICSVVIGIIMLVAAVYVPFLQTLLKTVPLGVYDWSIIFGIGIINLILIETTKHHFIIRHQTEN